jgi:HSP20 family molecular chaperone IbpA
VKVTENASGSHVLTISGERKLEHKEGGDDKRSYSERRMYAPRAARSPARVYPTVPAVARRHGKFSRSLRLPRSVDIKNISAKHENGVLIITVPRVEAKETQPVTTVAIQ